jgi:hypothetical protein
VRLVAEPDVAQFETIIIIISFVRLYYDTMGDCTLHLYYITSHGLTQNRTDDKIVKLSLPNRRRQYDRFSTACHAIHVIYLLLNDLLAHARGIYI